MSETKSLRFQMRDRRRQLTPLQQQQASLVVAGLIATHPLFRHSSRLALYLPNDAEIDLSPLLEHAWTHRKRCYLPVLGTRNSRRMWFLPVTPDTALRPNRYGILEPVHSRRERLFSPQSLDLVLLPLVAFDPRGHRVGMGGGFYDRTFNFRLQRQHWRKPRLLGTAYSFQQVDRIQRQPWDVPLDGIVTEQGLRLFPQPQTQET